MDADFKLALEGVEPGSGRLSGVFSDDLEGEGIAFRRGDVLFGKLRPYLAKVWAADRAGAAVGDFHVYRPHGLESRYALYSLLRQEYIDLVDSSTYGSKMPRANWDVVRAVRHFVPSLDEQRQIAAYLDRETDRIDELIAKQEQLLATLAERRLAVISSAVAPSSSGHEWVPMTMRRVIRNVDQGVSPEADSALVEGQAWGVLKSGCVNGGEFDELQHKRLDVSFSVDLSMAVSIGDFIVNRASGSLSLLGSAAIVRKLTRRLILSDKTYRFRFEPHVEPTFIEWFMQSSAYRQQVGAATSGAGGLANNLSLASIRGFTIKVPSLSTQRLISETLLSKVSRIDSLSAHATRMIALLRERRQALISAAVTGKIDVRSA